MKKVFLLLTMFGLMVACSTPNAENADQETIMEESVVDTTVMDSTIVDEMEFVSDEFEVTE